MRVDATARSDKKVRMGFCDGTAEALSRINCKPNNGARENLSSLSSSTIRRAHRG
jgi:hypothetical protein